MSVYRVHDGGVWSSKDLEYVYHQDIVFYDHLLNYFEDIEVKNAIRKKIHFAKANYGIFLMRNGELLKGLLKVIVYNNWFGYNSNKVSYRKVLSSIKQGCQNKIKMI
jgi:predicted DNA-binding transcriptional regulator